MRLLVVEDDRDMNSVVSRHLVSSGYDVDSCLDAGAAYGFVEQERWQGDPYVCLHQAMDWLDRELASNRYSG